MKYAVFGRAPQQLIEHVPDFELFVKRLIADEKRELFKQSKRFMNYKSEIGHNGNDFINGFVSIRVVGSVYKMSRIIKKSLYQ